MPIKRTAKLGIFLTNNRLPIIIFFPSWNERLPDIVWSVVFQSKICTKM